MRELGGFKVQSMSRLSHPQTSSSHVDMRQSRGSISVTFHAQLSSNLLRYPTVVIKNKE